MWREKKLEGGIAMDQKFAIIDLGSNSIRVIIMKVYQDGSYKMLDQAKEMVRLSEKMGDENTLKPLAIQRTISALKLFKKLIEAHKVDKVITVATAAVRNAANQQFFLDKVKIETGYEFTVISGEDEGYYDYVGVINTIDIDNCVIIDTGGASTEFILVENRRMKNVVSLPYGAVVLTEKFQPKDDNGSDRCKAIQASTEEFMQKQLANIPWLEQAKGLPVVGVGGAIRTLAKIDKKKIGFPLESLHNYQLSADEVTAAYDKVANTSAEDRKNIPGVSKDRADIIAAGLVPVKSLMDYLQSDKLVISGNGLREGVFFKAYLKACGYKDEIVENVLIHSIENTLKNYDANITHSYQVQKLALSLFDQLKKLHDFGDDIRKLLYASALLHDIGMYVDYYNHHKHGFYLVLNSRINGLTNKELVMCAFIVGMHENEDFKQNWKEYELLINKSDYEVIKKLSLFVRIAEKLDRNEYGSIEDVVCYITDDSVQMMVKSNNSPDLEIAAAMKNNKTFEKLFDKELYIV
ncbi:MAG: exopolyphosphatase / guanosine-5-triphosphate,3-diphosphate pyrophosphatase [Clostridiales bacterium]|nr:exopolyphosphatase / guanosine-5-triphosphate,3-diphosphate pyrophosphatase [Clostridiales bacterium]MDK2933449.1 exopolyphosphatase / guanosine-5-triphosphate,3-diphosphate pyrophosphatase [Clostridiales bacterium]